MATPFELEQAALDFVMGSGNANPELCDQTVFGRRSHGCVFEYDNHLGRSVAIQWSPYINGAGQFCEAAFDGFNIEQFIEESAKATGTEITADEVIIVATHIKMLLPEITEAYHG